MSQINDLSFYFKKVEMEEQTKVSIRNFKDQSEKEWNRKQEKRDSPGGPVAKTLHSQRREPRFNPWSGD